MNRNIFVSSTFRDMYAERDMLHLRVLPEVQALAWEYGSRIGLRDLRWGIDTSNLSEEDACNKILSVCNQEIDNCEPYMVVLLGMRYGWVPDENSKSVTEMEIDRGVFSKPESRGKILFLMRDLDIPDETAESAREFLPENANANEQILRLRKYVEENYADRLVRYSAEFVDGRACFDEFELAEAVTDKIKEMIFEDLQVSANLSPEEAALNHFKASLEDFNVDRIVDTDHSEWVIEQVDEGKKVIMLYGEDGNGKTATLVRASKYLRERGYEVFYYTAEVSGDFASVDKMQELCELFMKQKNEFAAEALGEAAGHTELKFAFLLDDIDKLDFTGREDFLLLDCLPVPLPENSIFVLAANYDDESDEEIQRYKSPQYLDEVFARRHLIADSEIMPYTLTEPMLKTEGKEVPWEVMSEIIAHEPVTPLELAILINRLVRMDAEDYAEINAAGGRMEDITAHMKKIIEEVPYYFGKAVPYTIERNSRSIGNITLVDAAIYIALSRRGLRMEDVLALCEGEVSELELCCLMRALSIFFAIDTNFVYQRNLKYKYEKVRLAVIEQLNWDGDPSQYYAKLCAYVQTLPADDPLRVSELPFLAMQTGNTELLNDIVNAALEGKREQSALQNESAALSDKILKIAGDDFYEFWYMDARETFTARFFKEDLPRCPEFLAFFNDYVWQLGESERFEEHYCQGFIDLLDAARACGMSILEKTNYCEEAMREFIRLCRIVIKTSIHECNYNFAYEYLNYIIDRLGELEAKDPDSKYCAQEFAEAYELGGRLWDAMEDEDKSLDYYLQAFSKCVDIVDKHHSIKGMYKLMHLARLLQKKLNMLGDAHTALKIAEKGYNSAQELRAADSTYIVICEAIRMKMHYAQALINAGEAGSGESLLKEAISEAEKYERIYTCDRFISLIAEGYTIYAFYELCNLGKKDDPSGYFEKSFEILKQYAHYARHDYQEQFESAARNYAGSLTHWDPVETTRLAEKMIDEEDTARLLEK